MRRKFASQKGASAVEFALVLPLLIIITFGIIEFGIYLFNQQVITNASREGARAGIVATGGSSRVTQNAIEAVVLNYCTNHLVTFGTANTPTVTYPLGYSSSAVFGTDLGVQVNYQYGFLVLPNFVSGIGTFVPGIGTFRNMKALTVMRYE
jgi:Flp pilus assembly protein TadG